MLLVAGGVIGANSSSSKSSASSARVTHDLAAISTQTGGISSE
jgi:hypothetical protein